MRLTSIAFVALGSQKIIWATQDASIYDCVYVCLVNKKGKEIITRSLRLGAVHKRSETSYKLLAVREVTLYNNVLSTTASTLHRIRSLLLSTGSDNNTNNYSGDNSNVVVFNNYCLNSHPAVSRVDGHSMSQWVNVSVEEAVYEAVNEFVSKWVCQFMSQLMSQLMSQSIGLSVYESVDEVVNESVNAFVS